MLDAADELALVEISESAGLIAGYVAGFDLAKFLADRRTCDAVTMQVFVIAEATGRLSDTTRNRIGDFDWRQMRGLRNRIAHGYGSVDFSIIWAIATTDIPQLARRLAAVLTADEDPAGSGS